MLSGPLNAPLCNGDHGGMLPSFNTTQLNSMLSLLRRFDDIASACRSTTCWHNLCQHRGVMGGAECSSNSDVILFPASPGRPSREVHCGYPVSGLGRNDPSLERRTAFMTPIRHLKAASECISGQFAVLPDRRSNLSFFWPSGRVRRSSYRPGAARKGEGAMTTHNWRRKQWGAAR